MPAVDAPARSQAVVPAVDAPACWHAGVAVQVLLADGEPVLLLRRAITNYCEGRLFESYGREDDETR
ncbi:MAG TPA: hypothetical protein VNM91_04065 [Dehalococcoidia bacterium]|nr:hypothetical protein [Dehalococcoidia bacterium]